VPRLRELLTELRKHPFLSGKLVLKGGTPLNLFYLERLTHARRREPGC
jgi:predicted nucleotidyltransferase component of viral defense system